MNYLMPFANTGALSRAAGAVVHHVRDVTLAEDAFRSGSQALHRLMSSLRTLTINLLKQQFPLCPLVLFYLKIIVH